MRAFTRLACAVWLSFAVMAPSHPAAAQSDDINVEAADAAYQAQRREADQRKRDADAAYARLQPYVQRVAGLESQVANARRAEDAANARASDAQARIRAAEDRQANAARRAQDAQRRVDNARFDIGRQEREVARLRGERDRLTQEITALDLRIIDAERAGNNEDWVCTYVDNGWEEHGGGHAAQDRDRAEADRRASETCEKLHGGCHSVGCRQLDNPEVRRLKQMRAERVADRDRADAELQGANNAIVNLQAQIRGAQSDYDAALDENRRAANDGQRAQNDLADARADAQRAADDARAAQRALDDARFEANRQQQEYDAALAAYRKAEADANARLAYLNAVKANYQRAYDAAVADGRVRGAQDGGREGTERAPDAGRADGERLGRADGEAKGRQDAVARDDVRGYLAGRKDGANRGEWAAAYARGRQRGEALAAEKARQEAAPQGFNDRFAEVARGASVAEATIDMAGDVPDGGERGGVDLSGAHRTVGNVPAPQYPLPAQVGPTPPTNRDVTPSVPAADQRHARVGCDATRRPEFAAPCRDAYAAAYQAGFADQYARAFRAAFAGAYAGAADGAYRDAFDRGDDAAFTRGALRGAEEQGVLDGFAATIAGATSRALAQGRAELDALAAQAYLPVMRGSALRETSGDGLLTGGETVALDLVIDNVAGAPTPGDALRVTVTGSQGLASLSHATRVLPSLAAGTKTTLRAAVWGVVAADVAGSPVAIQGQVEAKDKTGQWRAVASFTAKGEIRYPLELAAVAYDGRLAMGQFSRVTLTYVNRTGGDLPAQKLILATSPNNTEVHNPDGFTVPALAAGQSHTVDVSVKPGVWVGENVAVRFVSKAVDGTGRALYAQAFDRVLALNRAAALMLYDAQGRAVPRGTLKVKAGQVASFLVDFRYLAAQRRPGPFAVQVLQSSDPRVVIAPGGTTRVTYGAWGPGMGDQRIPMRYTVPADLKGKTIWVAAQLLEGNAAWHNLQVFLEVE